MDGSMKGRPNGDGGFDNEIEERLGDGGARARGLETGKISGWLVVAREQSLSQLRMRNKAGKVCLGGGFVGLVVDD
ncbi:hypothetical protein GH714_013400 [Hevea brasiliensis]|uniref:Uncharacterized protein n=1 Tax=Hevea brasiliensis TaxID=3981 RepID=A0A6A6LDB4_HEVBR|nr:hypothetical protein GH714_013400 [Hevea brasiliensis]